MTGGSIQQRNQSLFTRDREIRELEAALTEKKEQIAAEQAALKDLEERRAGSKEMREDAQNAMHQQEIAVARDTERLASAKRTLAVNREEAESLSQSQTQLDESLLEIEGELSRLERQLSDGQTGTEDLNTQTEALSADLDKARRERETAQEALTAAMLYLRECELHVERVHSDKKRLTRDREACEKERKAADEKRRQALRDMDAAIQAQAQSAEGIVQSEQFLETAKQNVVVAEEKLEQTQQNLRDLQSDIEITQKLLARETDKLHRQEIALERVRGERALLVERLWDSYGITYAGALEAHEAYQVRKMASLSSESEAASQKQVTELTEEEAENQTQMLHEQIQDLGMVHVGAIEEYAQMHERFTRLSTQKEDLERAKVNLNDLITRLLGQMETVFVEQFTLLQGYFEGTFQRLFGGGHGEIQFSDPTDPLNCGIEIVVQPPGKKRQILSLFSGGERALTAIAILFAMLMLKPTPFCILDEIEASLDEANIGYFADYLKEFSRDTQFVVVTHRKGTMERCDTLFGISMEERGISSMVSVNLTDYE